MTVWDHLVSNSTLAEAEGDAWEHLINPSGEGGGGDIIINSELITVTEDPVINVVEYSDKVAIIEDDVIILVETDDVIQITIKDEDNLDVIC